MQIRRPILKANFCLCLPLIALTSLLYGAQETPLLRANSPDLNGFIPAKWKLIKSAEGDLNKDGRADLVAIIEYAGKITDESAPPRTLFTALQNSSREYKLSAQVGKAIFRSDAGGMMGDPLEGLAIHKGSFVITYYGGSAWRWLIIKRFRYQDNEWVLIGYTSNNFFAFGKNAEDEFHDYNLLTGDLIQALGHKPEIRKNIGKKKILLKDFDSETPPKILK